MSRKLIVYELNEVPFRILDRACQDRSRSALAERLQQCAQYETIADEEITLVPWVTWPTVHRGVPYTRHQLGHFGQDTAASDAEYPPIWQILASHGVRTGVFASLHSYPLPDSMDSYAFYVPDVFAPDAQIHPTALRTFQEFNLSMSRESGRNVSARVNWRQAARLLVSAPKLGLRAATFVDLAGQLAAERRNRFRRVRRRTYQNVLGFDVFMKQLRSTEPAFCTFFTNHVASSMHRFWAAAFPEDYAEFVYSDEWVAHFHREIDFAMQKFDDDLRRLLRFVDDHPDYLLLVTSSMGQAATTADESRITRTQLYVRDVERFAARLGLAPEEWSRRPAMDPFLALVVIPEKVPAFRAALEKLSVKGRPTRFSEKDGGFFSITFGGRNLEKEPAYAELDGERVHFDDLGLVNVPVEDQTQENANHIPEGCLLVYDPQNRSPKPGRPQISTLDIAPAILRNFGISTPAYIKPAEPILEA